MSEYENDPYITKGYVFDIFYSKQSVVRGGGGKIKSKITRNQVSQKSINILLLKINKTSDESLKKYFNKLCYRSNDIAPPPRPKK
jgi:hypothetical protein